MGLCIEGSAGRKKSPWSFWLHVYIGEMLLVETWGKMLGETQKEALRGVVRGHALEKICRRESF